MLFLTICFGIFALLYAQDEGVNLSSRVYDGVKVNITEYPWSAIIYINEDLLCGAAIISDRWLATAGHCSKLLYSLKIMTVEVGTSEMGKGERYLVDLEVRHPDYIQRPMHMDMPLNDISLFRVNRSLTFSDKVQPIKLPQHNYEVNVVYKTAAMGRDETDWMGILKENILRSYNISEYIDTFNQTAVEPYREIMMRACIDTKRDDDKPSMCRGDSGSALVLDDTVVGLASFDDTDSCAKSRRAVYTNVFPFVDWIKNVIGIL